MSSAGSDERVGDQHLSVRLLPLVAPVNVNGFFGGGLILDTGANLSVLCESEAKRLGLKLRETTIKLSDGSGLPSTARVAVASDLWIGGVDLKQVAFAVAPDPNFGPFADLPANRKGSDDIPTA